MIFLYKAKKSLNEVVQGRMEGQSIGQVIEQLQSIGLAPLSVEPLQAEEPKALSGKNNIKLKGGKWGLSQLILFTQKLYNLINSRVELLRALRLLEKNCQNQTEKAFLNDIIKNIKEGLSFSSCLSRYPQYFSQLYINIVRTGETTGKLKDSFIQLLDYLRRIEDLKLKVRQALAYPIFMCLVGVGTIFVMLTFVLPRLAGMFDDFQAKLPLPTIILLNTANFLKAYWIFILAIFFISISVLKMKFGGKDNILSRLKYHVPIVKDIIYKQSVANFSRSISLLLQSGVNLLTGLKDASPLMGNPLYLRQLDQVRKDITEGVPFSDALSKFKIFPDFFVQMIRVGEEGGRLDSVLADIAESYEKEIEADLKTITSLIEPGIILALGLVIGGMVIAMLLPIFNMNSLIGG